MKDFNEFSCLVIFKTFSRDDALQLAEKVISKNAYAWLHYPLVLYYLSY